MDIDADQDQDVFIGDGSGRILFFENVRPPPTTLDVDKDGLPDAWEIIYFGDIEAFHSQDDPDADGLTNGEELARCTNPVEADSDGDGFLDGTEVGQGTHPLLAPTDHLITALPSRPCSSR